MNANRKGYRGYISARMEMGRSVPQHIQQLVIRDYCGKKQMQFLLSATEYCMEGSTLILDAILDELDTIEGIVMYSLYQMPTTKEKREKLYNALFAKGCSLHCAAEGIVISNAEDAQKMEDVWLVQHALKGQSNELFSTLQEWDARA